MSEMSDKCIIIVDNLGSLDSAKRKLCQAQSIVAAFDLTIPPIVRNGQNPSLTEIQILNPVGCGVQHFRAAGICAKVFTSKYYWQGNRLTFLTILDHGQVIISTYDKIVESLQTYWQIHRLQKRYFGRLEFHRKSFLDGMADEIESIIDSNAISKSLLMSSTQIVDGFQVITPKLFSIKEALKPLKDYVDAGYAEISKGFTTTARHHYVIDYSSGRLAGKKAYNEIFK